MRFLKLFDGMSFRDCILAMAQGITLEKLQCKVVRLRPAKSCLFGFSLVWKRTCLQSFSKICTNPLSFQSQLDTLVNIGSSHRRDSFTAALKNSHELITPGCSTNHIGSATVLLEHSGSSTPSILERVDGANSDALRPDTAQAPQQP